MTRRITDENWQGVKQEFGVLPRFVRYGSKEATDRGMVPILDFPDLLIPEDEWKERIAEAHEKKTMPVYHLQNAGARPHDQNGYGYCWNFGAALAGEAARLTEGQSHCRLAGPSLGWLVDWRNRGYYLSETIKGAAERGIATTDYCPDGSFGPRGFRDGWEEDALRHKLTRWFDTNYSSEKAMVKQCVSLLLGPCVPGYIAHNWWGHALATVGVKWDESQRHNLIWQEWNSHADGLIELTGRRGVPDEFYGLSETTFSP